MSTDTNSSNNILEVTSKPTNEKVVEGTLEPTNEMEQGHAADGTKVDSSQQSPKDDIEQVESVDPDHEHAMDETVADTDLKGQVNVAVDEKGHVVENEQVVIKNEQVEDLAEKVDVMDDDHQQGRRVDANRVSSDEQVIEVVDAEKVDMMDDNDQATHEQPIVSENQENSTKSDGSNDDEQDPATMLPRDQLPVVEALQTHVKSEVGGVAEKVDNDDQATQEQPIGFYYEKQENLTKTDESNDDDEQDIATILRHDQQPTTVECQPHVKSEVGSGADSTPVTQGYSRSSLSTYSALSGPLFSATMVDYAPQENDFIQYLLNSEPIPMSLPMNLILGNNQHSSVPRPKGIQQANRQHFQQMPIQNMASSEDNNSNRAYGNLPQDLRLDSSMLPVLVRSQLILPKIFDFPSYFERLLPFFTKFDDKNGLYYYICLIMLSFVYMQPQLEDGNDGSPFLRPQTNLNPHTNLLGAQEIQSQGLTPSQAAPAVNGSFYSPGTNFSQMNPFDNIPVVPQLNQSNTNNNAYQPVAGELPRATPRPRISMSNWQENVNIPAQNLLANNNWLPQGQSSQGLQNYSNNASASSSRAIKNALYDPKYEAMGLPIDPHLRLFLAQQRRENDRYLSSIFIIIRGIILISN
ncbi:unnamed protein product [Malus baccata var. baccata]